MDVHKSQSLLLSHEPRLAVFLGSMGHASLWCLGRLEEKLPQFVVMLISLIWTAVSVRLQSFRVRS